MSIFSRKSQQLREFEKLYPLKYQGAGLARNDAKKAARELLARAVEEADLANPLPPDFGDLILQSESDPNADPRARAKVAILRSEGVLDSDIRRWWNRTELERRAMAMFDDPFRLYYNSDLRGRGETVQDAAEKVRKAFPCYGDPSDTNHLTGEDRLLPYELLYRIDCWVETKRINYYWRSKLDHEDRLWRSPRLVDHFERIETSSSLNALIRTEIRAGTLPEGWGSSSTRS